VLKRPASAPRRKAGRTVVFMDEEVPEYRSVLKRPASAPRRKAGRTVVFMDEEVP